VPHSIEAYLQLKSAAPAGFSADGSRVLVVSNESGMRQLYTVPVAGGAMRRISDFAEPLSSARYIPGTNNVLVQMDTGGNERMQIYRMEDDGNGLAAVVDDPRYIHRLGGVSADGRLIAFASNRRNGTDFDIYTLDLGSGERRCVFDRGGWCAATGFSPDATLVAVLRRSERNADNDLHLVDLHSGNVRHVTPHEKESQYSEPSWLPDGTAFYFTANEGREFMSLARSDTAPGTWKVVLDAEWDASCAIDGAGRKLLVQRNVDGYDTLELRDPVTLQVTHAVPLPGKGVVTLTDAVSDFGPQLSPDGRYLAFPFVSAGEPGDTWLFDTKASELRRLTELARGVPRSVMVEPELHRFNSFDGLSVPAFVYRPAGVTSPPVVVFVHGGPESQYRPVYNPAIQYLVAHGFAVVAPNVRGSTGYGKRYEHLDDVRLRLDSVKDLAALHGWLPSLGVDAGRAALMGQSYGGYMVLAGLAFQPELWAAGVDFYGIANFVSFLENTAPWRRKVREVEYGSLENDREFLREASPLTHVEQVRAPLFLLHGANDPRVPMSETEQIRDALTSRGVACEMVVYADEGHGLTRLKNRLDAYPKVVAFLDRVLGR
jgi:dipeptidyl aminopeptidase/acylaminoacyl peptidase